jgi:hypothetical protein
MTWDYAGLLNSTDAFEGLESDRHYQFCFKNHRCERRIAMKREVGICRTTINGTEVTSFLDPPPPAADESLLGWVTRAAEDHAFREVGRALAKVGIRNARPESLPMYGRTISEQISFLLKAPKEEVETRVYEDLPQDRMRDQITFFGSQIRRVYRETKIRRVSPIALSQSPYHRAIWEVRIFGFCTDTKEQLLDRCPVCSKRLGWQRTHGIEYCDSCKDDNRETLTDLRDFPQPIVTVEDEAGLAVMCDLIHPLSKRREMAGRSVSRAFADYTNSLIFEFGIALCCAEAMQLNRSSKVLERPKCAKDYARFTPEILSHAGRAILDWPHGFYAIADRMRTKAAERSRFYGIAKELGPLAALRWERYLPQGLRDLAREAINRDMAETAASSPTMRLSSYRHRNDLITRSEASRKYKISAPRLARAAKEGILKSIRAPTPSKKGPLLLFDTEIADLLAKAARAETKTQAARRLGIPSGALSDLANCEMITKVAGPEVWFAGSADCYDTKSIDLLISSFEAVAISGSLPQSHVTVAKAVNRIGIPGAKPWREVFAAILNRELKIWHVERRSIAATARFLVEHIDRVYQLIDSNHLLRSPQEHGRISYREAADIIGTSEFMISRLIRAGQLRAADRFQLRLERLDVLRFTQENILTSEISERTGLIFSFVRPFLTDLAIEPVATTNRGMGYVWSRPQVEAVLPKTRSSPGL